MRSTTLLPALALVLLSTLTASAQNNMIRGKVRASNGTTVNNAIVELRVGGGGMIGQTVTRNDGDFAFSNLAPGEYEVAVTVAGYEPAVQLVRFSQNDRMNFWEVLSVEVTIRPRANTNAAPPGTHFAQDVPKAAREAYEKGVAKLREGKSDEGIALLREATASFNDYFDAHFAMGREFFRAGKDNEALEELERARQINDRQYAVYYMFGLVMLKQKKFAIAEYAFREAGRLNANDAATHFYRGVALIELSAQTNDAKQTATDLDNAEKELGLAWDMSEKQLNEVYLQRARVYERRGNKEAAARELENYLKAEPEAKNASVVRATIARLRGNKK
ncbi:MAG TPA: carboxypeptidase regulatory-like domain-containing protein [Blastocatellia bacterium]|jgi:tetratricopeptide (TPR) repeat protein|nr:carboxypeptidase regulatory-like domain-containing protein [Blastocatellia bacterium]